MVPLWNTGGGGRRKMSLLVAFVLVLVVGGVEGQTTVVGTDLGLGVVTRTPVLAQALLQKDLMQMEQAIAAGDANKASNLYQVGLNSLQYDNQGNELPNKRSLSSLSTGTDVRKQSTFAIQMYGLANGDVSTVSTHYLYADQFVKSMFADAGDGAQVAVEASTVLNLWMYTVAQLYKAVDDCALVQANANLQALGLEDGIFGSAPQAVDQAMGFYMGTAESRKVGLYAFAQEAANLFGTVEANGEATVNAHIRQLYEEAREAMSFPNACRTGTDTVQQLWGITNRWVSEMQVPLTQMLIYNMVEQDAKRIRLYSTAIIPATSVCRDSTHKRLREHLLDSRSYDANKFLATLGDLQELYDCLGFTCADVGALASAQIPECAGRPASYPMAEYSPSTNVHPLSKIDLDIKQIKVLVELEQYKAAKHLYEYGKNSEQFRENPEEDAYSTLSLQDLAITTDREKAVPEYKLFVEYYNDPNYADKMILASLDGKDKWKNNVEQRAAFITTVLQYHVIYLYALAELADTEADCVDKDPTKNAGAVESWDEVAAVLIGSLEAPFRGGSTDLQDGYFSWNLANQQCFEYNVCTSNNNGYAIVNDKLLDLLYAGKGELDALDCTNLRRTVAQVEHLLLVPLIQSTLKYASKNQDYQSNSDSKDLAMGEAFALSLLPFLASKDPEASQTLERNMILSTTVKPVFDGSQAVANALLPVMQDLGVDCNLVGIQEGIQICDNKGTRNNSSLAPPTFSLHMLSVLFIGGVAAVMMF